MSKTAPEREQAAGSRLWRGVAITALVVLAVSLVAGLLWFFADPLHLPADVLTVLDQRASVVGMLAGVGIGVAGLVIALMAPHAQARAERTPPAPIAAPDAPADEQTSPQVSAEGERSIAIGDNAGIASTGDGVRNVQMRAQVSGQGRVYQSGGDQTINER
ncbi:hypothetical protein [Nonomuraea sp. NPDC049141]|uniref:hypothetical protein n=1 Tax=Nonomuraea sp. NPDC049141 TaxID=3155500 RepID=UPI0033D3E967